MRRLKVKCEPFFSSLTKNDSLEFCLFTLLIRFFPSNLSIAADFSLVSDFIFIHFVEKHSVWFLHEPQYMPIAIILRIHLNHFYIITVKFIFNTWLRKRINDFNRFTGRAYPPAFVFRMHLMVKDTIFHCILWIHTLK